MVKKKKGSAKKKVLKKKPAPRKKAVKRPARKTAGKAVKKSQPRASRKKQPVAIKKLKADVIGKITHYFPKVRAAVIKVETPLATGDVVRIKGHTTDFVQTITSMQIDHAVVQVAKKGDEIGLLVNSRVRQHDMVYKEKGR